jgi:hypothetical protein
MQMKNWKTIQGFSGKYFGRIRIHRGRAVLLLISCMLLGGALARAQDTSRRKTIDITSTFRPVLKDASKINFNPGPPAADTLRPRLNYSIPDHFMFLGYEAAPLKPVALRSDTSAGWENHNYIKVGIGNVHQPYIRTGFSFGDQQHSAFNVFADQFNSTGSLPYQKNSQTHVALTGLIKSANNLEWNGRFGFQSDGYYLYGFRPDTLKYTKDQLLQRFQTFDGRISMRNMEQTTFGLSYHPDLHVSVFSDNHSPQATEANSVLDLPLQKRISDNFEFDLGFNADLTNYRRENLPAVENNIFTVSPALVFHNENLYLKAGMAPAWENKAFALLPDFLADISTNDQRFTIQLGWLGYYEKGSYQRFASVNPWLAQPDLLLNTRIDERFAGFKGSLNEHLTYSAKVSFLDYFNMPLFVNDSLDGKTFMVRYEPDLQDLKLHGEIAYTQGEQFSAMASLDINQFGNLQRNPKAFGLLPLELRTSLRWQIIKDLWIRGDLWGFSAAPWRGNDGKAYQGEGGFDLNAGIEFRIFKQLNLWFQMNNLFNDAYERWHQYQYYGFNFLGGIIYSFGQR